jgi:hypothetical protein
MHLLLHYYQSALASPESAEPNPVIEKAGVMWNTGKGQQRAPQLNRNKVCQLIDATICSLLGWVVTELYLHRLHVHGNPK